MNISNRQALAAIKVVLCVAKADGVFTPEEESALSGILSLMPENERPPLDQLLSEPIDLDAELAMIASSELRDQVYAVATLVANADGSIAEAEKVVLERIKPPTGEDSLIGQIIGETKETLLPVGIPAIHDPQLRAMEIEEDRMKYSILTAILGANPLPVVALLTDLVVVGMQVKLVRDIGQYYGHTADNKAIKSLIAGVAGSTVMRIAVSNLSRFVPGWGSVVGATSAFASTWAIGKAAEKWFESGQNIDMTALKATYEDAWKEGRRQYDASKEQISQARATHDGAIRRMQEDLAAKKITQEEYEQQLASLK
jgi:uncharacterized protein (DUF697 family)